MINDIFQNSDVIFSYTAQDGLNDGYFKPIHGTPFVFTSGIQALLNIDDSDYSEENGFYGIHEKHPRIQGFLFGTLPYIPRQKNNQPDGNRFDLIFENTQIVFALEAETINIFLPSED